MKKIFLFVFCAAICAFCSVGASAAETFATAGELYQYWQMENIDELSPYPDYICGVYTPDGSGVNLTFVVTKDEAGEAGKQEILDLVEDDSTVSFDYGSYSYAELRAVQQEIGEIMEEQGYEGSAGWGVDEMENAVYLDIDSESEGAKKLIEECFRRFGSMFMVNDVSGFVITEDSAADMGFDTARNELGIERSVWADPWLWLLTILLLAAASAAVIARRRALKHVLILGGEYADTELSPVERAVKTAEDVPPAALDRRIFDEIDKL
ncbi:MAG: hypothetical protein ACI3VB_09785 [Oscillospiraceae bacterium]